MTRPTRPQAIAATITALSLLAIAYFAFAGDPATPEPSSAKSRAPRAAGTAPVNGLNLRQTAYIRSGDGRRVRTFQVRTLYGFTDKDTYELELVVGAAGNTKPSRVPISRIELLTDKGAVPATPPRTPDCRARAIRDTPVPPDIARPACVSFAVGKDRAIRGVRVTPGGASPITWSPPNRAG